MYRKALIKNPSWDDDPTQNTPIAMNPTPVEELVDLLKAYNRAYRQGAPIVEDAEYDNLVEQLRQRVPDHPFLQAVEPEQFSGRQQVRHPAPMLSIEKAYDRDQLERFVARVQKEADALGIDTPTFRLTPKLDGLAGRDDGEVFATRGNGEMGYEISNAFAKGVVPIGGRGQGVGEIVVVKSYFEKHMAEFFEHPRNMVVGIVSSDTLNENAKTALDAGMVRFVPYNQLQGPTVEAKQLVAERRGLVETLLAEVDYPTDGVVVAVTDEGLKNHMGATAHHYRWQIAIKSKGDTAETAVEDIQWQVGRTGNVTPVMMVAPVSLSGATIRRVTAHHAGNIRNQGIGIGTRIEIIRSGEVIPKLEKVLEAHGEVRLPETCPSCSGPLTWQNDFLKCTNPACRAQIEQRISHWFRILGNADWFGIKTIGRIVESGHRSLEAVYRLTEADFLEMEFGPVQSKNLAEAITLSRTRLVEDWRFLAAFGISDLGTGDSRKLLAHFSIEAVLSLEEEQIEQIKGFGKITSKSIAADLKRIGPLMAHMLDLGFNLQRTPLAAEQTAVESPIAGKGIVFTGKMVQGSREAMQAAARAMGARVQTAVSGTTDYLVCGEKVGAAKMAKATRLGVSVMTEAEYQALVNGGRP
ncbi:DNA ligase [Desulfosarcina ovata subsp. sediminis]|uniref:DNA ligase n=1 Tax=Desulfosarcina ovata subsp. sediminis TaxID=885957 RepID=A0A5K8A1H8_9BACT|nr:BRCT domain-containing protein [Desulfosarcina ovata]BBO86392.1 DNA ligase [Desulfosarcina ovata subsp. sediminis]